MNFVVKLSTKYSKLTFILAIITASVCLWHAATHLDFDTNQDHLISKKQKYLQDYTAFLKEFGDWEYIYVVTKVTNPEDAKAFASDLTIRLKARPDLFREVVSNISLENLKNSFLLLSSDEEFQNVNSLLLNHSSSVQQFFNIRSTAEWYTFLNSIFENQNDLESQNLEKYWPFLKDSLFASFDFKSLERIFDTNFYTLLSDKTVDPEGYLFSENGKLLFVRILPNKDFSAMEIISEPLKYLRQQIHDLNYKYPELTMGITGRPVLQNDEANSTQSDSQIAGLLSFILVALLFLIFFRSYKRSLFSLLSLLIGIAWTTGFVSLIYGSINLITIVFAVILIGLGIDYGIHFLIRYQNEKYDGAQTTDAIKTTTLHTGSAIFFGALTSAIAFGTALLTDFLGLQQLGLIAGVGIILCCLSQLLVFPSLLNLFDHKKLKQSYKIPSFKKLEFLTSKPILVIAVAFLITVASLPFAFKTGFNNNILEMQDPNLESVKFEKLIQDNSDISTWFLSYKTKDLAELKKIKSEIEKLKTVKKTDSILNIVPSNQIERITILKNSLNKFQDQALLEYSSPSLTKALTTLIQNIDNFANKAFKNGLVEEFNELDQLSKNLRKILNNPDPIYGQEFINIIKSAQYLFANLLKPKIIDENKIPDELLSLYKSQNGFYSLTIFPKKDIWNPDNMEEFIQDVRHIIPNVTGAPITSYESAKRLVDGFVLVAILTALLVLTIVYFEFKNIKITLIIFFNLIISIIWLGAFMDFNNIPINLANFFALPVLIGSGIDHGIHIFHRYRESGSVTDLYRSTIPAVTLSCLTTIFGFASLSFVHHKGLASFGFILAIGTGLIMLSSIILLPNVIKFLEKEQEYDLWPETEPSIKTMAP